MIYIGSDHGGYNLKETIKKYLEENNIEHKDLGANTLNNTDDYPDFALKVAKKVAKNKENKGILICGTGIGMCMTANKVKGVRAALCYDERTAKLSREHNDSNILCLGGRTTHEDTAIEIVNTWLNTKFNDVERHKRRVEKMNKL